MTPEPSFVSVIEPVGPAIERVKTVLFRPFDLGRWFIIGFCAWLAQLGQNGGGGGGSGRMPGGMDGAGGIQNGLQGARDYVVANLYWIVPVAIITVVIVIGLWLLITWLSSRGRFMFLYCVAQNKAEVTNPWHQFAEHADRLFGFRVVVGIIAIAATAILMGLIGAMVYFVKTDGVNALAIVGAVAGGLLLVAALITFALVGKFTKDFVVPIMYLRTVSPVQAWRVLLDVLSINKGRFFLYLLFQFVIGLVVGAIMFTGACITCGCLCCLSMLPYVGTVVLLPIFVFQRAYSLFYLTQYGSEFNVFVWPAEPAAPIVPPLE